MAQLKWVLAVPAVLLGLTAARADDQPGVRIGGQHASTLASTAPLDANRGDIETCVDVELGTDHLAYAQCLLTAARDRGQRIENHALNINVPSSDSSPAQIGEFTAAAERQRFGQNFGHSLVTPVRPTNYASFSLLPRAGR